MSINYRVSSVWKAITSIAFKVSGVWKGVQSGWVNVGGTWKQFYSAFPQDLIAFAIDSTDINSWLKCNGSDVVLDLIGKYPKVHASEGGTGGQVDHSHNAVSGSSGNNGSFGTAGAIVVICDDFGHTHTINHTHAGNINNEPAYLKVLPVTAGSKVLTSMFLFYEGSSAPSGWSNYSSANDKLFKGDAAPQTSPTGGNASHSHSHSGNSGSGGAGGTFFSTAGGLYSNFSASHIHTINHTHTGGQNYPLWVGLLPISPDVDTNILPSGIIAFFKGSVIPSGWSAYSTATGKWIQGKSAGSGSGGANTHNHVHSGYTNVVAAQSLVAGGSLTRAQGVAGGHRHTINHTESTEDNIPPYQELMLLKKD